VSDEAVEIENELLDLLEETEDGADAQGTKSLTTAYRKA